MTNPTRTRADLSAAIDRLTEAAFASGRATSAFEANPNQFSSEHSLNSAYAMDSAGDEVELCLESVLTDLIPREEHEAALAEAVRQTERLDSDDAVHYLIRKLQDGWAHAPNIYNRVYTDGQQYRVTVERVDADKPEPADAEPVGWANRYEYWFGELFDTKDKAVRNALDHAAEIAVPLYRHPAPAKLDANTALKYLVNEYDLDTGHIDAAKPRIYPFDHNGHVYEVVVRRKGEVETAQAVAPKGVVKEIRRLALAVGNARTKRVAEDIEESLIAALSRITELPEPSEWAKEAVEGGYPFCHRTVDELRDLAAALLAKDGDHE